MIENLSTRIQTAQEQFSELTRSFAELEAVLEPGSGDQVRQYVETLAAQMQRLVVGMDQFETASAKKAEESSQSSTRVAGLGSVMHSRGS